MLFDKSVKQILCILLAVAMIGGVLGILISKDRREVREREALVMKFEKEKRVYDQRINELNKQLRQKREELLAGLPSAPSTLCIGVKASSNTELLDALRVVEPFGYPITVILDAELPSERIKGILDVVRQQEDQCVILCGDETAMLCLMEAEGDIIYPFVYLNGIAMEEMKESLAASGFIGCSKALSSDARVVSTSISADFLDTAAHIPIGENNALNAAAADAAARGGCLFLTVEMEYIGRDFTMSTVTRVLERIQESYVGAGTLKPTLVSDYLDKAREYASERKKAEAVFAVYEEQKKAEIAELEAEIAELAEKYRWW